LEYNLNPKGYLVLLQDDLKYQNYNPFIFQL